MSKKTEEVCKFTAGCAGVVHKTRKRGLVAVLCSVCGKWKSQKRLAAEEKDEGEGKVEEKEKMEGLGPCKLSANCKGQLEEREAEEGRVILHYCPVCQCYRKLSRAHRRIQTPKGKVKFLYKLDRASGRREKRLDSSLLSSPAKKREEEPPDSAESGEEEEEEKLIQPAPLVEEAANMSETLPTAPTISALEDEEKEEEETVSTYWKKEGEECRLKAGCKGHLRRGMIRGRSILRCSNCHKNQPEEESEPVVKVRMRRLNKADSLHNYSQSTMEEEELSPTPVFSGARLTQAQPLNRLEGPSTSSAGAVPAVPATAIKTRILSAPTQKEEQKDLGEAEKLKVLIDLAAGLTDHLPFFQRLKCEYCPELSDVWANLKRHQLKAHGERFKSEMALTNYILAYIRKEEAFVWLCFPCQLQLPSQAAFKEHLWSAHSGSLLLFPCDRCPELFGSALELARHRRSQHRHRWMCSRCRSLFASSRNVKRHQVEGSCLPGPEAQSIPLPQADKEEILLYACEACNHHFLDQLHLTDHLVNVHGYQLIQQQSNEDESDISSVL